MSDTLSYAGQIDVVKATIISSSGSTYDISGIMADLTIYEDMFSNTMSGYVLLEDATDMVSTIPLLGQEIIQIELNTPTLKQKIKKSFYIYKLQHRSVNKRVQTYMLNFCSKELITSSNSKVSKAFSGNIGSIVSEIFGDDKYIGSDAKLYIEKPKNSYTFIAPYWTPLETINWLTGKSLNKNDVPNYIFYENNKSFEFISIDSLIELSPKRDYVYSDVDPNTFVGTNGSKENKFDVVESIENSTTFDYLRNLNAGMYASKLYTVDLTTKNISTNTYDYIKDFDKSNHLNDVPLKRENLIRKKSSSIHFIQKNNYQTGELKQQGYSKFFLQRNSLLEQMFAFKIVIKVHGRTDIKAGDTINFSTPNLKQILKDGIETDVESKYFSGKYLITAIRHQILSGKHTMLMEIVSDSFVKKVL